MNDSKRTFNVRVIPRARQNRVEIAPDGTLRVHTTAAPADGAANAAVIKMLAAHFDVPKTSIQIVRGASARDKVIQF
ncbi:MAG: DUF167 domain-containing protein [Pseudomonadota bacterium]|nr:DUF167 domain-containing protein [Pseudomonadota bacterium]